jgi:hypothetical protein
MFYDNPRRRRRREGETEKIPKKIMAENFTNRRVKVYYI